jgi:hypothetical protein
MPGYLVRDRQAPHNANWTDEDKGRIRGRRIRGREDKGRRIRGG